MSAEQARLEAYRDELVQTVRNVGTQAALDFDPDWREAAADAIRTLAASGDTFDAEDCQASGRRSTERQQHGRSVPSRIPGSPDRVGRHPEGSTDLSAWLVGPDLAREVGVIGASGRRFL